MRTCKHRLLPVLATLLAGTAPVCSAELPSAASGSSQPQTVAVDPPTGEARADTAIAGGFGTGRWGEIPPPGKRNTILNNNIRRPLWENVIYYPYQVVAAPFRFLTRGGSWAVANLSGSPFMRTLKSLGTASFLPIKARWGVSAGGDDGYGLSFTTDSYHVFRPEHRLKVGLRYTTRDNTKATLGILFNAGHKHSFPFGIVFRHQPDARYYGLGWDAPASQESRYTNETLQVGGGYRREFGASLAVKILGLYSEAETEASEDDDHPLLETVFPAPSDRPYGYGERSTGVSLRLALERRGTPDRGRPQCGSGQRLAASYFSATDDSDVAFWTYRAELQQFVPLWHTRRALALRGVFTRLRNDGAAPIPFQRLLHNDEPDLLRGHLDQRFRDEGLLVLSAEYRFPVWNYQGIDELGLDAYLFYDWGQVFAHGDQIALERLAASYGGGLRLITTANFIGRFEIGHSDEGTVFRLRADQVFQYAKGGLYDGRSQIPLR